MCEKLIKVECQDPNEAIAAVRKFVQTGPNDDYVYDNFRGYRPNGDGTHIGRSRFWLSSSGKEFFNKTA